MAAPTPDTVGKGIISSPGRKSVLLWFLLILMFVSIYQMFSTTGTQPNHHTAPPPPDDTMVSALLGTWLPVLCIVGLVLFFAFVARHSQRINVQVKEASDLMARGNLREAAERFEAMASRRFLLSASRSAARHNLGWLRIRQGRPREAIQLLSAVENPAWRKQGVKGGLGELNAWRLAQACALAGEADAAGLWLNAAQERKKDSPPEWMIIFVLVRLRGGRPGEAAGFIDDHRREAESRLTGDQIRMLGMLRAFAESLRGPRESGRVESLLPMAQPLSPGDFDYLAVAWPELQLFLRSHGMSHEPVAA